ncbi:hypothetical protein NZK32_06295 [Cyanobium sp. FGCU-52]|nr:hypothetical protein [Cyanobium sp. FGCU52]
MTSGFPSHRDDPDLSPVTAALTRAGEEPNRERAVTQEHADAG